MFARALLAGLTLLAPVGCLVPSFLPPGYHEDWGTIPEVTPGDTQTTVKNALGGPPHAHASGWWSTVQTFNMDYTVWYYKGKGRVIFDRQTMTVHHSEADPEEDGRP